MIPQSDISESRCYQSVPLVKQIALISWDNPYLVGIMHVHQNGGLYLYQIGLCIGPISMALKFNQTYSSMNPLWGRSRILSSWEVQVIIG